MKEYKVVVVGAGSVEDTLNSLAKQGWLLDSQTDYWEWVYPTATTETPFVQYMTGDEQYHVHRIRLVFIRSAGGE